MNREQKRAMQRAGQLNADGSQATKTRDRKAPAQSVKAERTKPAEFVREVRGEIRKVIWPTRAEVIRLSTIVLVALIVVTAFVFGVDWVFGQFFTWLLDTGTTVAPTGGG